MAGPGSPEMCIRLLVTTRAEPVVISVDIEVSRGPIVETLLIGTRFLVYEVNPKQLDRRRRLLGRRNAGVLCRDSLPRRPE
jgi:hypothetical protein